MRNKVQYNSENDKSEQKINSVNKSNQTFTPDHINEDLQLKSSDRIGVLQTEFETKTSNNNEEFELILPENALNFVRKKNNKTFINEDILQKDKQDFNHNSLGIGFKKPSKYLDAYYNKHKLQKYNYNKFIFNDSFQNKIKTLNSNFNKELDFQKRLLKLKKNEKIFVEEMDFKKKSGEYKIMFMKKIQEDKKKFVKKAEIKHTQTNFVGKIKQSKQKIRIEQSLIKSLDAKCLSTLRNIRKESMKNKDNISYNEKNDMRRYDSEVIMSPRDVIMETKEKLINIEREIDLINKIEKHNLKTIHPIKYRERVPTARKLINDKQKQDFKTNFTKLYSYNALTHFMAISSNDEMKQFFSTNN